VLRHPAAVSLILCLSVPTAPAAEPLRIAEVEGGLLAEAKEGAERHRKGDATLVVVRRDGKPVAGRTVLVRQETHEFLFGALLFGLVGHGGEDVHRPEAFKSRFKSLFNLGILPYYWSGYEPVPGRLQWPRMTSTIEWALANDTLYLLQARPITSLFPLPAGLSADPLRAMLSFGAVQGMLDPITPLGRSLVRLLRDHDLYRRFAPHGDDGSQGCDQQLRVES